MPKDDEEEEDPEKTQLQQQCSLTSAHFHKSAEKVVVKEDASKVGWLGGLFVAFIIWLRVSLYVYSFVCMFVCLFDLLFVCLSVCLFVWFLDASVRNASL